MSRAYKQRKNTIRDEKKARNVNFIPGKDFLYLQANWQRKIDGPPVCTLADLARAR